MSEPEKPSRDGDPEGDEVDRERRRDAIAGAQPGPVAKVIRSRVAPKAEDNETRRRGAAYQGAMEAVLAIPIAIGLGYWADQELDTGPIGIFVGVVIGFAAFVLRLLRMRRLIEPPAEDAATSIAPEAADSNSEDGRES